MELRLFVCGRGRGLGPAAPHSRFQPQPRGSPPGVVRVEVGILVSLRALRASPSLEGVCRALSPFGWQRDGEAARCRGVVAVGQQAETPTAPQVFSACRRFTRFEFPQEHEDMRPYGPQSYFLKQARPEWQSKCPGLNS